jgi:WD40 repeat protein
MLSGVGARYVLFLVAALAACCVGDTAQCAEATFKKGDRVEVESAGERISGTVVSIDSQSGLVEILLDRSEVPIPDDLPAGIRDQILTRVFHADRVRAIADASAAPKSRTTKQGSSAPAAATPPAATSAQPTRTWTDRTGKFSVTARFQKLNGDRVVLLKDTGKTIEVPLEKLSEADAKYVRELPPAGESPFDETPLPAGNIDGGTSAKKKSPGSMKTVRVQPMKAWSYVPSGGGLVMPAPGEDTVTEVRIRSLPSAEKRRDDKTFGIFPARGGLRVALGRKSGFISNEEYFLEVVDAMGGETGALIPLPEKTALVDVDLDLGLVAYRSNVFGHDKNNILTIAKLADETLTTISQWEPYGRGHNCDIGAVKFLDANRVLTANERGEDFGVSDVGSGKPLLSIDTGRSRPNGAALSDDRKLLAIDNESQVSLIDLDAGRQVGALEVEDAMSSELAFRGDNARLAHLSYKGLTVWDLSNGKRVLSMSVPYIHGYKAALEWAGPYLLISSKYLFDVDRRLLLWEYEARLAHMERNAVCCNGKYWIAPEDGSLLIGLSFPNATALKAAATLPSPEELLIVKPGDSIAIEVDFHPDVVLTDDVKQQLAARVNSAARGSKNGQRIEAVRPADSPAEMIRKGLAAGLQAAGYKVVDKSTIVMTAVCKPEPEQTIKINTGGDRFNPRPEDIVEQTIKPHSTYVAITKDGRTLWEHGTVAKPHAGLIIYVEQGETLEQALVRLTQPNTYLFTEMRFDSFIATPGNATAHGGYGKSNISSKGFTDLSATDN